MLWRAWTLFARCVAVDGGPSVEVLKAAARHKGTSVVEVLQNCVIFNDGTHDAVAKKKIVNAMLFIWNTVNLCFSVRIKSLD